ncbi:DHA2 family efflux MFS transporter permease subunit [Amycolatopsis mediterranei]|nr:DHA2 family efflux MFS transporter permease subunit [Amycolatopsis mediterranei]UZF67912.1 DHA2 family efflux MFS transporter permease subunit [Amycolatopsis mediterranei]
MNARQANPWAALGALCLGFFMILLDTTIVSIAIPTMLRELGAGLNSIVWVISVYLLTYAVPMLFTSRLGDRFGPKRVFLAGLLVFTGASLWCGLSGNVEMLIAARAVQGLGAALMTPQTLAFITHLFPPAKRGPAMGMWGGVAGLATIAGPLLGGVLVDHFGWEWIFFVNVPIGVIAVVLTLVLVPDWQPKHSHSFDLLGIVLSSAALLCIVFGVQNGQQYDWGTVFGGITVFEIIAAGVVLLIAFVVWQRFNQREPLLPLQVFSNRNFSAGTLTAATVGFAMTGMFLPLVIYIQSVLGLSPTMGGLLTAPMSLLSGIVAPFVGRASDKVNGKYLVMFGLAALAAGLGIIALQATPDSNAWTFVPALLVCGLGIGCIFSPMSNLTMGSVEPRLAGTASGIFNTARQVGGVLGSAAIGVLLQARISASIADEATKAASQLPAQYRAPFAEGIAHAAASTGEFGSAGGPSPMPGLPAEIAAQAGKLATEAVHSGLTDAARVTMLLPMGVLLLGVISAAVMQRVKPRWEAPAPAPETAAA